jgi:hypothetical protein
MGAGGPGDSQRIVMARGCFHLPGPPLKAVAGQGVDSVQKVWSGPFGHSCRPSGTRQPLRFRVLYNTKYFITGFAINGFGLH